MLFSTVPQYGDAQSGDILARDDLGGGQVIVPAYPVGSVDGRGDACAARTLWESHTPLLAKGNAMDPRTASDSRTLQPARAIGPAGAPYAWLALAIIGAGLGYLLTVRSAPLPGAEPRTAEDAVDLVALLSFGVLGAELLRRKRATGLGWSLMLLAALQAVNALLAGLGDAVTDGQTPTSAVARLAWMFSDTAFIASFFLLVYAPLALFPTGRLPSRRWRWLTWVAVAGTITMAAVDHPGPRRRRRRQPGDRPEPPRCRCARRCHRRPRGRGRRPARAHPGRQRGGVRRPLVPLPGTSPAPAGLVLRRRRGDGGRDGHRAGRLGAGRGADGPADLRDAPRWDGLAPARPAGCAGRAR